jgi:hypothetical protein
MLSTIPGIIKNVKAKLTPKSIKEYTKKYSPIYLLYFELKISNGEKTSPRLIITGIIEIAMVVPIFK